MQACSTGGVLCSGQSNGLTERKPKPPTASITRDPSPIPDLPVSAQFQTIGGPLTPQRVSSIVQMADAGYPQEFVDLFHELRQKDGTLHAVLQTRELALSGLEWVCESPEAVKGGKRKKNKAQKIADETAKMIRNLENLPVLWAHLCGEGNLFGHAHAEIQWKKENGQLIPYRFKPVACRRFVFRFSDGKLLFSDLGYGAPSTADVEGVDLMAEYPAKFVEFCPRVTGDVPIREGLARILVWLGAFRNWDMRDWLFLAELGWKPWRKGKYKKDSANDEDIENLRAIINRLTSTGACVYPDSVEIEVEWPHSSGNSKSSNHKELFDALAAELAKAVLGQTLTTEQGSKGSQALGRIHDLIRRDILEADAKGVAWAFREYVIKPFVEANFGANAPIPLFRFKTEDGLDITAMSEAIKALRDAGVATIPERWVREQFGIPDPEPNERCVGGTDPTNPDNPSDPNAKPIVTPPGDDEEKPGGSDEDEGSGAPEDEREAA